MTETLTQIPVTDLHPNPTNPRLDLDGLDGLTASIKEVGIIQPLRVVPNAESGYTIIAGHRRHAGAIEAGLDAVPCIVSEDTEAVNNALRMLHENMMRDNLSVAEQARGIQQVLDLGGSIRAIATTLGATQADVRTMATASKLPEQTQTALHTRTITLDEAFALSEVEPYDDIYTAAVNSLAEHGSNGSWIVRRALNEVAQRKAEAAVEAYAAEHECEITNAYPHDSNVRRLNTEEEITAHLGQPCYAVRPSINADTHIIHMCVNTRKHGAADPNAVLDDAEALARKVERRRVIENNKTWQAVTETRQEWLATFTTRKTPPKGAIVPIARLMGLRAPERACYLTAAETITGTRPTWAFSLDDSATITTADQATRLLMLTMIADLEKSASRESWRQGDSAFTFYLTTLASWGYALTPPEAAFVAAFEAGEDPSLLDYSTLD